MFQECRFLLLLFFPVIESIKIITEFGILKEKDQSIFQINISQILKKHIIHNHYYKVCLFAFLKLTNNVHTMAWWRIGSYATVPVSRKKNGLLHPILSQCPTTSLYCSYIVKIISSYLTEKKKLLRLYSIQVSFGYIFSFARTDFFLPYLHYNSADVNLFPKRTL